MDSCLFRILMGLSLYGGLVLILLAAGMGLQRLLCVRDDGAFERVFFAPMYVMIVWTLILGVLVGAGITVRMIAYPLWGGTLALAFLGITSLRKLRPSSLLLMLICVLAPVLLLWRHFFYVGGLWDSPLSILPDGWSYMAYGEYIWKYSRGSADDLSPLYSFASHLNNARYISRSMLSFFKPLTMLGDTRSVAVLLHAVYVFIFASSCVAFSLQLRIERLRVALYVSLLAISGWMGETLWMHNYDNMAALPYLPLFAGCVMAIRAFHLKTWIGLGVVLAALLFVYPELSGIIVLVVVAVAGDRYWSGGVMTKRQWGLGFSVMIVTGLILFLPVGHSLISFAVRIFNASNQMEGSRPGETLFSGLLHIRYFLSAFWGYGGQHRLVSVVWLQRTAAVCAFALVAIGGGRLIRMGYRCLVAWGVICVFGCLYWVVFKKYDYAAYKMILMSWWLLSLLLVLGGAWRPRNKWVRGLCLFVFSFVFAYHIAFALLNEPSRFASWPAGKPASELREIQQAVESNSVAVAVDDGSDSLWAMYYLRDAHIRMVAYRSYTKNPKIMKIVRDSSRNIDWQAVDYVLAGAAWPDGSDVVWSNGVYKLWIVPQNKNAQIVHIENRNGLENEGDSIRFWMGDTETVVGCYAGRTGMYTLKASVQFGENLRPDIASVCIRINNQSYEFNGIVSPGDASLPLELNAGYNEVSFQIIDLPVESAWNTTDPRILMVRLSEINIQAEEAD